MRRPSSANSAGLVFTPGLVLLVAAILSALLLGCSSEPPEPKRIEARVVLNNQCGIADNAFQVLHEPSGRRFSLARGEAWVPAVEGDTVRLVANSAYPDFAYDGSAARVSERVVLVADCGFPDRMRRTFESLRDEFGGRR